MCKASGFDVSGIVCSCVPGQNWKCLACKLKATAKRYNCEIKAVARAANKGASPDVSKCVEKFNADFQNCEEKQGPCLIEGDATTIAARIDGDVSALVHALQVGSPSGAFLELSD